VNGVLRGLCVSRKLGSPELPSSKSVPGLYCFVTEAHAFEQLAQVCYFLVGARNRDATIFRLRIKQLYLATHALPAAAGTGYFFYAPEGNSKGAGWQG